MSKRELNLGIEWQLFPKNLKCPDHLIAVLESFQKKSPNFDSTKYSYKSNEVLKLVENELVSLGFLVETGKTSKEKIHVPVLFGKNGKLEKYFEADAYNAQNKTVIEVEAGRAFTNFQFLKDLFEACVMHDVEYCVIAVRKIYRTNFDFEKIIQFLDTLYASDKFKLPLTGVLIIGY